MTILKRRPFLILTILFFVYRLPFILKIPIFNDEALYLDWANRIIQGTVSPFYSLYDGTLPGLLWIFGIFSKLISDPLISGRIVAVLAGYLTLTGIYKLSKKFSSEEIEIFASLGYITIPLFLFYDRQALMESSVTCVGVWSLYFLLNYFKKEKLKDIIFVGLVLGVGLYIKGSVFIFISTVLILLAIELFKIKSNDHKNAIIVGVFVLAGTIFVLYTLLLFQQGANTLFSRSDRYILSGSEILSLPIDKWVLNLINVFEVSFWHLIPTTFAIVIIGIYSAFKNSKFDKRIFYFFVISLLQLVFLARLIQSRYLVSFVVLTCIFFAYGLKVLLSKSTRWIAYSILVLPAVASVFLILNPFEYLNLMSRVTDTSDLKTYYQGFTSGYGIDKVREFLETKSKETPIMAGVRLDSGNPESAIFTYYGPGKNKRIEAIYFDSKIVEIPEKLNYLNSPKTIYFISRGENLAGMEKYLKEEIRYYNPTNSEFIGVYRLKKEGE
jgi:4-amino-4-deoxy-L-arabinose transferase-like glycosyltransferase